LERLPLQPDHSQFSGRTSLGTEKAHRLRHYGGEGGGADKIARLMQNVIEKHKLSSKPTVPNNKPGGSGAEALIHFKNAKRLKANHTIMVTLNSFYATPCGSPI
jgi:tripartite-type tricarboxylate transporter receptor subunit TctC